MRRLIQTGGLAGGSVDHKNAASARRESLSEQESKRREG